MPSVTRRASKRSASSQSSVEDQFLAAIERLVGAGHSFTEVSIEQLSKEAGVSRGTFYLYFEDKGSLVKKLLGRLKDDIFSSVAVWYEKAGSIDQAEVRIATKSFLHVLRQHNAILSAVRETATYDPEVKDMLDGVLGEIVQRSQTTMTRVKVASLAHPDASAHVVAVLTWLLFHGGLEFASNASDARINKLAESFTHIFRSSLFVPETSSGGR